MKLISFSNSGRRLLASISEKVLSIFPEYQRNGYINDELVLITHYEEDSPDKSVPDLWKKIHHAWKYIQSDNQGKGMLAWRVIHQYGEEIAPEFRVFRLKQKESKKNTYFYLHYEKNIKDGLSRIIDLFFILSSWQHTKRSRAILHAAGVIFKDSAYLFVGPSGSGKSTVSKLSANDNFTIIHDDHVVVYLDEQGQYKVTDHSLSIPYITIRAILFLNQDTTDRLVPLSPPEVAKGLLESSFNIANLLLHGHLLQSAFAISSDIARSIPGYNLHFRKSPDFWNIIDSELET